VVDCEIFGDSGCSLTKGITLSTLLPYLCTNVVSADYSLVPSCTDAGGLADFYIALTDPASGDCRDAGLGACVASAGTVTCTPPP
jgi:hypothetical protein